MFLEAINKGLFKHSRYAWICAVLYVICAALRLARFNVETEPDEESHLSFCGLPTPAAAGVIAGLAIVDAHVPWATPLAAAVMPFMAVILGGLMISNIRYAHVVNVLFRNKRPFKWLVLLVFLVCVVFALAQHYELILLAMAAGYMLSGPIMLCWRTVLRKRPTQ